MLSKWIWRQKTRNPDWKSEHPDLTVTSEPRLLQMVWVIFNSSSHLVYKARICFMALRVKQNCPHCIQASKNKKNTVLFPQTIWSKPAGEARDKTQHLAGETADPLLLHASVCLGMCRGNGMDVRAWRPTEKRCVTNHCLHPRARDTVPISLAWLWAWEDLWLWDAGAWSHRRGTERDVADPERRDRKMEGKPSWRLLLIGLSRFPWLTRPICSADPKRERATSTVAGPARLQAWGEREGGVKRAGGWEAGHTPVVTVSLCQGQKEPAVTPWQERTHSTMCTDNTSSMKTLNRSRTKHFWNNYFNQGIRLSPREEWIGHNMKDRKGPDEKNRGVWIYCSVPGGYLLHATANNQKWLKRRWTDKGSVDSPSYPPTSYSPIPVRWGC